MDSYSSIVRSMGTQMTESKKEADALKAELKIKAEQVGQGAGGGRAGGVSGLGECGVKMTRGGEHGGCGCMQGTLSSVQGLGVSGFRGLGFRH